MDAAQIPHRDFTLTLSPSARNPVLTQQGRGCSSTPPQEDLGQSIDEAFASFDPAPIASASIAQVYRATLPDGRRVAVKIQQRPVARFLQARGALLQALASLPPTQLPRGTNPQIHT